MKTRLSMLLAGAAGSVLALACASGQRPSATLPHGCISESAWPKIDAVDRAYAAACIAPASPDEAARCDREDYLEAVCEGINTWREEWLGVDRDLASFDVRFPWPAIQAIDEALDLSPGHTGSESWADHLGLAPYHDNSIKATRRQVMNYLTLGFARRWYDARGLGSPPG